MAEFSRREDLYIKTDTSFPIMQVFVVDIIATSISKLRPGSRLSTTYISNPQRGGLSSDHYVLKAVDEVEKFRESRYLCAQQALWRLLAFGMHERYPSNTRLAYRLSGEKLVVLDPAAGIQDALKDPDWSVLILSWIRGAVI